MNGPAEPLAPIWWATRLLFMNCHVANCLLKFLSIFVKLRQKLVESNQVCSSMVSLRARRRPLPLGHTFI